MRKPSNWRNKSGHTLRCSEDDRSMDKVKAAANLDVARLISDFSNALSLVNGRPRESGTATQAATGDASGPLDENQAAAEIEADDDALPAEAPGWRLSHLPLQSDPDGPVEDDLLEDLRADDRVIGDFLADHETLERLGVTDSEIKTLMEVRLCGSMTCKEDVLQVLRSIRSATQHPQIVRTSPSMEPDGGGLDFSEMADRIRREALARLNESARPTRLHRFAIVRRAIGAASVALLMIGVSARKCMLS
jgi:hypothetical protein